jgi:hypothetical protein
MSHGAVHVDHYRLLGGVCVDYCVAINRTDLLFGPIFTQFQVRVAAPRSACVPRMRCACCRARIRMCVFGCAKSCLPWCVL